MRSSPSSSVRDPYPRPLAVSNLTDATIAFLRLNGVSAMEHPVFRELTRVKQYFEKIQTAENGSQDRRNLRVDKQAAARVIKHSLVSLHSLTEPHRQPVSEEIKARRDRSGDGDNAGRASTTWGHADLQDQMQDTDTDPNVTGTSSDLPSDGAGAVEADAPKGNTTIGRRRKRAANLGADPVEEGNGKRTKRGGASHRNQPSSNSIQTKPTHTRWS